MIKKSTIKKILFSCVGILIISSLIVGFVTIISYNKPYDILASDCIDKNHYSLNFSTEEKNNINSELKKRFKESNAIQGFSEIDNEIQLYNLYSLCRCNSFVNDDETLLKIQEASSSLASINLNNIDMQNAYYYLYICDYLKLDANFEVLDSLFSKLYDGDNKLFNCFGVNDNISNKLLISYSLYPLLDETLKQKYEIPLGFKNSFESFTLKLPNDNDTLFNSGGDLVYGLYAVGEKDFIFSKDGILQWYSEWKESFKNFDITSLDKASFYCQFLEISEIFNDEESILKLEDFLSQIHENDNLGEIELNLFSYVLEYADLEKFNVLKNKAVSAMGIYSRNIFVEVQRIDIYTTYYGCVLSSYTGFQINKNKILSGLNETINSIDGNSMSSARVVPFVYYYVLINCLFHEEETFNKVNKNFIKACLDDYFENLSGDSDSFLANLQTTRQALEIVSFFKTLSLVTHSDDDSICISKKNANKIIDGLKKIDSTNYENILSFDLFVIDRILKSDLFSSNDYDIKINKLNNESGGFSSALGNKADLYSSYYVYSFCFSYHGNFEFLNGLKEYVRSLKTTEGLFRIQENEKVSLRGILYGNEIEKFVAGSKTIDE